MTTEIDQAATDAVVEQSMTGDPNPDAVELTTTIPKPGEYQIREPKPYEDRIEQDLLPSIRFKPIKITVEGEPIEIPTVIGWKILMRPKRMKELTDWGFELSEGMQLQEAYAGYVSQILSIGEGCFQARDQGGVDMSKWEIKPQVGDWVIHTPYSGYRIRVRGMDEMDYLIVMDDTEIHCIVNNPEDYYGVIDVSSR